MIVPLVLSWLIAIALTLGGLGWALLGLMCGGYATNREDRRFVIRGIVGGLVAAAAGIGLMIVLVLT